MSATDNLFGLATNSKFILTGDVFKSYDESMGIDNCHIKCDGLANKNFIFFIY